LQPFALHPLVQREWLEEFDRGQRLCLLVPPISGTLECATLMPAAMPLAIRAPLVALMLPGVEFLFQAQVAEKCDNSPTGKATTERESQIKNLHASSDRAGDQT